MKLPLFRLPSTTTDRLAFQTTVELAIGGIAVALFLRWVESLQGSM